MNKRNWDRYASQVNGTRLLRGLFLAFLLVAAGTTTVFGQATTPEQTVKAFYKWYIHEMNAEKEPTREKTKLRQYVSARLVKWVAASMARGDYDADYFIDGQDYGHDWGDNIVVSKVAVRGATATLHVKLVQPKTTEVPEWIQELDLKLVKEAGSWKIDRIKGKE